MANADPLWSVFAATSVDRAVVLRNHPDAGRKVVTSLAPGTTVHVIEGPDADGWFRVEAVDGAHWKPGWVEGAGLVFAQCARAVWDMTMFAGAGDWSAGLGSLRHGMVVSLVGAVSGDFALVRSGDLTGYVALGGLETSDGPASDPYGERRVDVNRSSGQLALMIGDTAVDRFDASLGSDQGDGFYATASGEYSIYSKVAGLSFTKYARAYFEYWAGFDPSRDNGFHAWTIDANGNVIEGGSGPTGGCVATAPENASVVYDFVDLGTQVEIHW
ncbi:MAG: L,D-transpeptidase family protein [Thermomicrobiales bacterium]